LETVLKLYFAFVVLTSVVITIVAVDLVLGRTRDLPSGAHFRTAHLLILAAYLALGATLVVPFLLVGAGFVLIALLVAAYLVLGTAQAAAIMTGLEERGIRSRRARLGALLLAYLPVLGSAFAVWGATVGWRWTTARGLKRFFGPHAAIVAPPLLLFGYVGLQEAGILS
jgi:hypothetical protein